MNAEFLVGVISDTHGLLRPQALEALAGAQLVIHAGDVGSPDILPAISRLAPVEAVRGNVDTDSWALALPETTVVEVEGRSLYVLHDVKQLDLDPRRRRLRRRDQWPLALAHERDAKWRPVLQSRQRRPQAL